MAVVEERTRSSSAVLVVVLVMAGACVAQAFGRFTYGVILPGGARRPPRLLNASAGSSAP
jgi:hypothetical protein